MWPFGKAMVSMLVPPFTGRDYGRLEVGHVG